LNTSDHSSLSTLKWQNIKYIQSAYRKILTQNKGNETEKPYEEAEKSALK
jgi:hypothetical protein